MNDAPMHTRLGWPPRRRFGALTLALATALAPAVALGAGPAAAATHPSGAAGAVAITGTAPTTASSTVASDGSWSAFEASCAPDPFACGPAWVAAGKPFPTVGTAPRSALDRALAADFPQSWDVMHLSQTNDGVDTGSPALRATTAGIAWASPLTGPEILRVAAGFDRYGTNGGELWGAAAAQALGNVTGVTAADGLIFVEESNGELFALDATTGIPVWEATVPNTLMGNPIVQRVDGRLMVFVAEGDLGWTLDNTLDRIDEGVPQQNPAWGYGLSGVYAFAASNGAELWQFATRSEVMPTPAYADGSLFFDTGGGHLYALDAATGMEESSFAVPGAGVSCMSSVNLYRGPGGSLEAIFGTDDPYLGPDAPTAGNDLVAVNETDPRAPTLAWNAVLAGATGTSAGGDPAAVDQSAGIVVTDVLTKSPGPGISSPDLELVAVDAATGQQLWQRYLGNGGVVPPSLKNSVPMIHDGVVYVGDTLNETFQAYSLSTGTELWSTPLVSRRDLPGTLNTPRGGAVYLDGKVVFTEGFHIWTLDAATGAIENDFIDAGIFGIFGITSPTVIGSTMYLAALPGWAFAVPVSFVTTNPGPGPFHLPGVLDQQGPPVASFVKLLPGKLASFFDPAALPTPNEAARFPALALAYAGGPTHDAVTSEGGPRPGTRFSAALPGALPLAGAPVNQAELGQSALAVTQLAFGSSYEVTPARGLLYVGSDHDAVEALNATTGALAWRFDTINADEGQPLVTPQAVVVSSGDQALKNATGTDLDLGSPGLYVGMSFEVLHGLDPTTGRELWSLYTKGTDVMTPLYSDGNLYWVDGSGNVWAVNASTGDTFAPFETPAGAPTLGLGGVDVVDSANIVAGPTGPLMVVGTADPAAFYAIRLTSDPTAGTAADTVAWRATLPSSLVPYVTGFAGGSPVVDAAGGLVIESVLVNAADGQATDELVAFDTATGAIAWTTALGTGQVPQGWTAATPVLAGGRLYVADPVSGQELAVDPATGSIEWRTALPAAAEGPGAVVDLPGRGAVVIQGAGGDLVTLDAATGTILRELDLGGSFSPDGPSVIGRTVYIGNAYGWVFAVPLASLLP